MITETSEFQMVQDVVLCCASTSSGALNASECPRFLCWVNILRCLEPAVATNARVFGEMMSNFLQPCANSVRSLSVCVVQVMLSVMLSSDLSSIYFRRP
jgi:hypothetical protein